MRKCDAQKREFSHTGSVQSLGGQMGNNNVP